MLNLGQWGAEARYFAMVLTMAEHMPDGPAASELRARVLDLLADAVVVENDERGVCRDLSVAAATRRRLPWYWV